MIAEPEKLRSELAKLVRGRLTNGVSDVEVEARVSEDGNDFLLVTVRLTKSDLDDAVLEQVLESIEEEVAKWDERYPSVRFQEAA